MAESLSDRWRNYQPSKRTVFWSFFGEVVATLVVGFSVFDWYTAGGARALADNAAEASQAELASAICVERFMNAPDAAAMLADLKEESTWSRDGFIEDGGWITFNRFEGSLNQAADLCAETLAGMEAPTASAAAPGEVEG